jgi:glycosyltransferase involved in cell wall biosynthesis
MKPSIKHPDQGYGRIGSRPEAVLLICCFDPNGVPSIIETVAYIQKLSRFPVTVLNLFEHRFGTGYLTIHPDFDLNEYAAIIIHNTVSFNIENLWALDSKTRVKLKDFAGVKILFKQDDHFRFREIATFIAETSFDLIFTLVPAAEVAKVYDPKIIGAAAAETMLAAYVTPAMRGKRPTAAPRPIDIGYRGSIMPLSFGRLCYEKRRIGEDVKRLLADRNLVMNISSRWEDRIGGDSWLAFLGSCKGVLGVEGGSGIFDLDGNLEARCRAIEAELGPFQESAEYAEAYLSRLADLEGNVKYFMISPRHFEAICSGALQILLPGEYSGKMIPGRHYIELQRDYSNLDEAVTYLVDETVRSRIVEAAYEEVLLNKENWIETFVERVNERLEDLLEKKGRRVRPVVTSAQSAHNVVILQAHQYGLDPRRDRWIEEGAPSGVAVHQIGIARGAMAPFTRTSPAGNVIKALPIKPWQRGSCDQLFMQITGSPAGEAGLHELYFLDYAAGLDNAGLARLFGAPLDSERVKQFRWYINYLLSTASTLIDAVSNAEGVHALVAINLPTLIPALLLKSLYGIPVIYEALEYWPEADPDAFAFEVQYWSRLERRLVIHTDARNTVSPGLAQRMAAEYGRPFNVIPNAPPLNTLKGASNRETSAGVACQFLFQGNFAPYRGIDLLIQAWGAVGGDAVLILRGPDNAYKAEMVGLARGAGLLDKRVFFPPPVHVDDLVQAAHHDGDVGIIPYTPRGENYKHCSPNKLGQYLAAGLPVLANNTSNVSRIIGLAQCGLAVDFSNREKLVEAIHKLAYDPDFRRACSTNGVTYFKTEFHWEKQARPLYEAISSVCATAVRRPLKLYERRPLVPFSPPDVRNPTLMLRQIRADWVPFVRPIWRVLPSELKDFLRPLLQRILGR